MLIMRLNTISFCFALTLLSLYVLVGSDNAEAIPAGVLPSPLDNHSVDKREVLTWPGWSENNNYSVYLGEKDVLLDKISFQTSEAKRGIAIFVDKLWRRPVSISSDPPGASYAFLQLSLNKAAAESADKMTLYFTVEDRWLEFNTLTKSDVRLTAYDQRAKSWTSFDTDFKNGIFSSSAPSNYSIFSIATPNSRDQQEAIDKVREEAVPSNVQKKEDNQSMEEKTQEPAKEIHPDTMENKDELISPPSEEPEKEKEELPTEPRETSGKGSSIASIVVFLILGTVLVVFGVRQWIKR